MEYAGRWCPRCNKETQHSRENTNFNSTTEEKSWTCTECGTKHPWKPGEG